MAKRLLPSLCFKLSSPFTLTRRSSSRDHASMSLSASPGTPSSSATTSPDTQLRRVFERIDSNGDGRISTEELRALLECAGNEDAMDVSLEEAGEVGEMGYEQFVCLMEERDGDDDRDIRRAFEAFEAEKGSGYITPDGLCLALHRLGEAWWTPQDCARMIRAYDADGNGVIDYHEFRAMMAATCV